MKVVIVGGVAGQQPLPVFEDWMNRQKSLFLSAQDIFPMPTADCLIMWEM